MLKPHLRRAALASAAIALAAPALALDETLDTEQARIRQDIEKWRPIVKASGFTAED